jgi:hypothetical protein
MYKFSLMMTKHRPKKLRNNVADIQRKVNTILQCRVTYYYHYVHHITHVINICQYSSKLF